MSNNKMILSNERRPARARAAGAFLSAFVALASFALAAQPAAAQTPKAEPVASYAAQASRPTATNSYAAVVSRVAPAVVTVRSERRVRASQRLPFLDDPQFREFFGDRLPRDQQQPRSERQRGLGSGVIVSADGYVLTNHHVVEGAEQITVELNNGQSFSAKLVGSDPPSDLAVLKVETAAQLPVLALGNSDNVQVGDVVLAIGNPLGIGQTVTSGIISAKGRQTGLGDGSFEDFLQTDAAINRGNSGGALVSAEGELIGINSQILSPSGGSIGIGFSIPANMARDVMNQLIQTGRVRRGMVGVTIQPVTADIAASLDINQPRGALVSSLLPGGPAERAGLRRGDIIVAVNNTPVADSNAFRNTVARIQPGTPTSVTVLRDGREQQFRLTLGELPVENAREERQGEDGTDNNTTEGGRLGVTVEPLTPDAAARMELPRDARGLVVTGVSPDGPAADAGLRRGDVIQEVNRQPVGTREDLRTALTRSGTRPVLLLVMREGQSSYLTVRLTP